MTQDDPKNSSQQPEHSPDLDDVAPGSDADATPVPPVGETPPDPNAPNDTDEGKD